MSLRAPTPSRIVGPSGAKPPEQKTQYRVEELLVKIRTLEHTIDKNKAALVSEETRSKEAMQKVQQTWKKEREDWKAGCDAIQAAHRINFLTATVDLEKQKSLLLEQKDELRRERLARMQRDFRLTLFQIEESRQEDRIAQLETELEEATELHRREVEELQSTLGGDAEEFRARCTELEEEVEKKTEELETALEEKAQLEALSSLASKSSELERLKLRYEDLKSTHAELEAKYTEAQQTNTDLRRQLDKWKDLESREGNELEELRKTRIELEMKVQELEQWLEETSKKTKERKQKIKALLQDQQRELEEANETADRLETEAEDAKGKLREAEKKIHELQVQLEIERAKSETALRAAKEHIAGSSRSPRRDTHREVASEDEVENVVVASPPSSPKPRSKVAPVKERKPASKRKQPSSDVEEMDVDDEEASIKGGRSKKGASRNADLGKTSAEKGKKKSKTLDTVVEDDEEIEDIPTPKAKARVKRKAVVSETAEDDEPPSRSKPPARTQTRKASTRKAVSPDDGEIDREAVPSQRKGRRKAKADDQDEDSDRSGDDDNQRGNQRKDAAKAKQSKSSSKAKPSSRQPSATQQQQADDPEDEAASTVPKKKKRKINLFPSAQPTTFNWGELSQGPGGLNIPTDLSPVKETDAVPPRSTSRLGSVFSRNPAARR
ncbi:hypothetical protein K474DRAFT_1706202 [Panus rudis PR-1116 ss-1]|nr:hypothetical protein K474DRAFT_1706202 [Panus rudis PR-1116 ss-1]